MLHSTAQHSTSLVRSSALQTIGVDVVSDLHQEKRFYYEQQEYQEKAVANIVGIFDDFHKSGDIVSTLSTHYTNNNYQFPINGDSKNIDVMMETGTGKTFTFIKAIFELTKHFGYKKFIILTPTVPIREGTKTNLEDTKDYFKGLYNDAHGKEINVFVYESSNVSAINDFIKSGDLSALVMTPSSFDKGGNILNRPLEKDLYTPDLFVAHQGVPKSYLECLKRLNPIVIMDEPHRFEGNAFKKYFEGFDNFFLRFGATFPKKADSLQLSNVAYVLDSLTAFQQSLVKKIVVYTQDVIENTDTLIGTDPKAKKAMVNRLENGMLMKQTLGIGGLFNGKSIKKINKDVVVLVDGTLEKVDYAISDDSLRVMIRDTIKLHFDKEQALFDKGIKTLSLFFMENDIGLFRGDSPKIKIMFEEEYLKIRQEILTKLDKDSAYCQYLQKDFDKDGELQVHKGYFSGDKGSSVDEKIKAGVNEILKDKKRLLSFESSTRFIFSIWALQEGWDNPNIFTICKLSNQGSENSKLQQIGRGLRIAVNQDLQRQTLAFLDNDQELFWQINNLDVVVSSKEQGFVESIQKEILENSFLLAKRFTEQEIRQRLVDGGVDEKTARSIFKALEKNDLIVFEDTEDGLDVYELSDDFDEQLKTLALPADHKQMIAKLFSNDIKEYVKNANKNNKGKDKVIIKPTHLRAFEELWHAIYKNTSFLLEKMSKAEETQLIDNIKAQIESLDISRVMLETTRSELHVEKMQSNQAVSKSIVDGSVYVSKVDYLLLVRQLAVDSKTPLSFVVRIFNVLSLEFKQKILVNNPKQAQKEMADIIKQNLMGLLKTKISYGMIQHTVKANVFKTDDKATYLDIGSTGKFQKPMPQDFSLKAKWVFENVIEYDSDFELEIIEQDPDISEIEIFAKLPRLKIKTPLGEYNPDFCYAIKGKNGNQVFLVVESKGYEKSTNIPPDEKTKIDIAKKYFDALNEYYQKQGKDDIKIVFKERINKTQLSALINTD